MESNNDDNLYTKTGFLKSDLLGDDLNRKTLLAGEISKRRPQFHQYYNEISEKAAGITYGKYSYFLHLCYARKLEELEKEVLKLLNN